MNIRSDAEILEIYKEYQDYRISVASIVAKYNMKSSTLIDRFKKLKLTIRLPGFRPNNCHGRNGENQLRLQYLWFFKFSYKRRAARKGFDVTLTNDEFIKLVTSDCHYCDKSWESETRVVNRVNRIKMLTVYRKDSDKGYTLENCVSCCKICNTIKMDLSYEEFMRHIKKVHDHLRL